MTVLGPLALAVLVVCVDLSVFVDARAWERRGTPVVFRFGSFTIETPQSWAVACLLLFVFAVPVYAVARREA